jgi:hypothetical protein
MALAGLLLGWAAVVLGIIAIVGLAAMVVTSSGHAVINSHAVPQVPGGP